MSIDSVMGPAVDLRALVLALDLRAAEIADLGFIRNELYCARVEM